MLVSIAYCSKDLTEAKRLAAWIRELGPYPNHSLLVARDISTNEEPFLDCGFATIETIVITDDVWKKWPDSCNNAFQHISRYNQFAKGAQPFLWLEPDVVPMKFGWVDKIEEEYRQCGKPFLGDYVSVHTPELDVVDHMSGVAVYPGDMVRNAGIALLTRELAWDVAAVHQIVPKMAKSKLIHHAWKHPEFVSLHQVQAEIYNFKPQCVLFHASKDGSLIKLLSDAAHGIDNGVTQYNVTSCESQPKQICHAESIIGLIKNKLLGDIDFISEEQKSTSLNEEENGGRIINAGSGNKNQNSDVVNAEKVIQLLSTFIMSGEEKYSTFAKCLTSQEKEPNQKFQNASSSALTVIEKNITCDILIKSYPGDYEFLKYCLESIEKFVTGFRQVVLIVPKGQVPQNTGNAIVIEVEEHGDGYMMQQSIKANAHEFTDAPFILHIDSDTIFTRWVTPKEFFRDGKPLWLKTSYSSIESGMQKALEENPELDRGLGVLEWRKYTEKFLGEKVEFEFMRRMPMFVPREVHELAARFCLTKHKLRLSDYIMEQKDRNFSEFNMLGALAHSLRHNDIYWLDTEQEELPQPCAMQAWSWGGLTEEVKTKFETILSSGEESRPASHMTNQTETMLGLSASLPVSADRSSDLIAADLRSDNGSSDPSAQANFVEGKNGNVEGETVVSTQMSSPDQESTSKLVAPSQSLLEKRQALAAHARAVAAENRRLGIIKPRKKRKRNKRRRLVAA